MDEVACSHQSLPPHEATESRGREIRGRPADANIEIALEAQREFLAAAH